MIPKDLTVARDSSLTTGKPSLLVRYSSTLEKGPLNKAKSASFMPAMVKSLNPKSLNFNWLYGMLEGIEVLPYTEVMSLLVWTASKGTKVLRSTLKVLNPGSWPWSGLTAAPMNMFLIAPLESLLKTLTSSQ